MHTTQSCLDTPVNKNSWRGPSNLEIYPDRAPDPAWQHDNATTAKTNYSLNDGDTIELLSDTKGTASNEYFLVRQGALGKVICARTPRVTKPRGRSSCYFANSDIRVDDIVLRVRVPYQVLKKIKG